VLEAEWGKDWRRRFKRFQAHPIAAASIGQVHRAETHDGRLLAIKVQYPGVAESIDADVDNVAALLRVSGLIPSELDIAPLLAEPRRSWRGKLIMSAKANSCGAMASGLPARWSSWCRLSTRLSLPRACSP
jgi:hypothetical protein